MQSTKKKIVSKLKKKVDEKIICELDCHQKLQQANEQLNILNKEIKKNSKDLEELKNFDQIKDRFLWITSHEMRTPLTVIKWYSSLLLEWSFWVLSDEQKEFIDKIFKNTIMLITLVDNMLDVTKLKSWKVDIVASSFDLKKLFNSLIKEFLVLYKDKDLKISLIDKSNMSLVINTDQNKLKQIMLNLLTNACKFTPNKWSIEIIIEKYKIEKGYVKITVKDNWIWIPDDKLDNIFDEYNQIDNYLQREYQWSWLWLVIAKNIVRQLKWDIWVESKEWQWSKFIFTISTNLK